MAEVFSESARLQGVLDFEAALARAESRAGLIPAEAAAGIAASCRADLFDLHSLRRGASLAGNLAIPVVNALTDLVGRTDPRAARYVHWGATSQDAQDTGQVLQLRRALHLLEEEVARAAEILAQLADRHR